MDNSTVWLRLVFAVIFLSGTWVGFSILFCGIIDEETRHQKALIRATVRAARKKASQARKRVWSAKRDQLFCELSKVHKGSLLHQVISAEITTHLAKKP
jgi:hypothetical protein